MKSIAIMQPYFFPYIGYYQLFAAVDTFVFLDDVSFRKKSYINRNSLNYGGIEFKFSMPVSKVSQNRNINEHEYIEPFEKICSVCEHVYGSQIQIINYREFLKEKIFFDNNTNVSTINQRTIVASMQRLGLTKEILMSSQIPREKGEKGKQRILSICEYLQADRYINLPGGRSLYIHEEFNNLGIELKFIEPKLSPPFYSYLDHCFLESVENQAIQLESYHITD